MSSRSSAALVVLWVALMGSALHACPPRPTECVISALRSGQEFQQLFIGESAVGWSMDGQDNFEMVTLSDAEVQELTTAVKAQVRPCVFHVTGARRSKSSPARSSSSLPFVGVGLVILLALIQARRRQGRSIRVLTRAVERRETGALLYVTLLVVGLIYATWSSERYVDGGALENAIGRQRVTEATVRTDGVRFRVQGESTTFVVNEIQPRLERVLAGAVAHVRAPGYCGKTTHRPLRTQSTAARYAGQVAPWIGALAFWMVWVRMIKRQSWW